MCVSFNTENIFFKAIEFRHHYQLLEKTDVRYPYFMDQYGP